MDAVARAQDSQQSRRLVVAGWIYAVAVVLIVLGLVHCGAAVLFMRHPAVTMLPAEWERVFLFTYLAAGVAVIFSGSLVLHAVPGLRRRDAWAWILARRIALMLLILGAGAVIAVYTNPFAQLLLLFALAVAVPLWWYRDLLRPRLSDSIYSR